jgi:zinc protease
MRNAVLLAAVVALVAVPTAPARSGPITGRAVKTTGDLPSIDFERYNLPNGLQIILAEDHRLPLVAFDMWFHVGARNEVVGRTGFAHLFEHLMFAGTRHLARGVADKLIEGVGGTDYNGTTDFDRTRYFFTLPSNQLELGLWIKSDMMGYMLDQIDQVALANQQDVVRNERRQSVENQPYGIAQEAVYHALYPKDHPHHAVVIGSHADIQAATLKDVKAFFKTFYRPNNATLALVGDFDKARVKPLIEKYFAALKPGEKPPAVTATQPKITAERKVVVTDRVELPRTYLAWHTPAALKPGDAELDLAAYILAGGKSSRLYKALVYEQQIAQDVNAGQSSMSLGSVFTIDATARPGHGNAELEKAIDAELARLAATPPAEEELQRARNTLETRLYRGLEKVMGIASQLNSYNQLAGDPGFLPRDIQRYRAVKPADITRVLTTWLKKEARVVVHAKPGKQELGPEVPTPPVPTQSDPSQRESVNADESWRNDRPKAGPTLPPVLPAARSFRLANGLTVVLAENPGVPVVSAALVVKAGAAANPADRPGLAGFCAAMLAEGTQNRSALQLADDVASLGASLNVGAGNDDSHVGITSLRTAFPAALEILADVALAPAFAPAEIDRQKKNRLAGLLQQHEDPNATAAVVAAAALFGAQHPLGKSPLGSEAAIEATTRDDLVGFWRTHYRPDRAALVVAGDITLPDLKAAVQDKLGPWKATGRAGAPALAKPAATSARLVLVDKPGAPQTALVVASFGPRATDPALPQLSVMNAVLGGNFTSRINHTLREVKGYTYGMYSEFAPGRDLGLFAIQGSVRTDVTAPALADLFSEIEGVRKEPVPAAELQTARNSQMLSLPGMFDTNAVIAGSFAMAWSRGQGLDYFARLPAKLARVDAATTHRLARRYVVPEQLVVVAVGDKAKIGPALEAARQPVEVRDVDGNPLKTPGL